MTADEQRLQKIFHPHAMRRTKEVKGHKRLVHYTGARAAMSIIQNAEVWMRNATCMNDYSEVQHGLECLASAYRSESGQKLRKALDDWFPGFCKEFESLFDGWQSELRIGTYLLCVSEHENDEDTLGRLSMWRAYGDATGVALVMKAAPFFNESDALQAYTSPVAYLSAKGFEREFGALAGSILENAEFLRTLQREQISHLLFNAFLFAGLCTKHPGYVEEREWRVIHCPKLHPSERLVKAVEIVGGAPQVIYKIPLKDVPDEGLTGIEIAELLDRLIIGPTEYPAATYDAFVELLRDAGVPNPEKRVCVSEIPLRR